MLSLYMGAAGKGHSEATNIVQNRTDMLDDAIEQYNKAPGLDQDSD